MKLRQIIKSDARSALRGNRGRAVSLLLLCMAVSFVINMADAGAMRLLGYEFTMESLDVFTYSNNFFYNLPSIIVTLITVLVRLILVVPLGYGILNWYLELTDRRSHGVLHIFVPYESKAAARGVLLSVNIAVKLYLLTVLLLVPPLLIAFAGDMPNLNDTLAMVLVASGILLMAVALLLVFAFAQRFAVARILLCEKYQLTTHQAIKQSVHCTKGHLWELVRFKLSFLPWLLPVLGVGAMLLFSLLFDNYSIMPLWWMWIFGVAVFATHLCVTPYYTMSKVMYGRYLYEAANPEMAQPAAEPEMAQPTAEPETTQPAAEPEKTENSPSDY